MSEKYDVVIVGSGLGGLQCGYILSKEGYSVCILEKNRQFGGNLQIFVRNKTIFDTGIHYLGGLDEGQNLNQYFKYFDIMKDLKLKKLDADGFDRVSFDNDPIEYKYAQGFDNFIETMSGYFPEERAGIKSYCNSILETVKKFPLYNLEDKSFDLFGTKLDINAKSHIASFTNNVKLQNVLGGTNSLYVGYPDKTPFYVHALIMNNYMDSAYKCVDGGAQIATLLKKRIAANGGVIRNYCDVQELVSGADGNIKYALLQTGEQIEGKQFISNIHPAATLDLVKAPSLLKKVYRNRISGLENTMGCFSINIAFKEKTFKYINHNFYHFKVDDVWSGVDYDVNKWPEGYAAFVPAHSKGHEFAESMSVLTYMRMDEIKQWEPTFSTIPKHNEERGNGYEEFKQMKAERLIDVLEEKFPNIRSCIKAYYTSTPLTYRDYIGDKVGSLYGIAKDYNDTMKTFIAPKTKIPNLFLTGQNLSMHGVLGVTISSIKTCGEFVGESYLLDKVKKAS
jgi:all-trans-retinol 13,14-reductase